MEKIKIESSDGYLHLKDLPHNCIFNKVITGCGGTTIVLENNENYVIAVPTTELIVNKTGVCEADESVVDFKGKKVFGLFGAFDNSVKSRLKKYLKTDGIKKVMCTYDKLPKLIEYLNPKDYRLLIDEYHSLLKAYSYRDKAIDGVLDCFKDYKSFCFMSATPIQAEFKPICLESIEEIVADWKETDTLLVKLDRTNKPYLKAAQYINAYKTDGCIEVNDNKSYEAFFFINSVTDIASILRHCNLTNEEVKIVCADNERNRKTLEGYTISNSRSENKKFTFITSKSFEGADYYSENAMCFVVSSSSNPHTLAAIDTDIPQIAGRIRTKSNPFRNILIHIFNTSKLNLDVTYDEMVERTNRQIDATQATANLFNNADTIVKDNIRGKIKRSINDWYMSYDSQSDTFKVNDILPKLELYNYQLNQIIYKSGLSLFKAYWNNDIATTEVDYERFNECISKAGKKLSFKEAFLRYAELTKAMIISPELNNISKIQPLVVPAYHKLGIDKVRALRYVKSAVEDALTSLDTDKNKDTKIAQILSKNIVIGFNSSADTKQLISDAYNIIGIKYKAKATDLSKWFDCEASVKWIEGKSVKGFKVYRPKFMFN